MYRECELLFESSIKRFDLKFLRNKYINRKKVNRFNFCFNKHDMKLKIANKDLREKKSNNLYEVAQCR